ncbi:DNA repair protein [Pluteus cervinus]|uniref:DNA repair protein n=1 Tax=Pluteus cervinus TaxID=181527 RepID=A0ACD3A6X1_9AGAR|nr:DNA repair protein [Pluteus cervinus]
MSSPINPYTSTNSSDYYEEEDSAFLEALRTAVLPGDKAPSQDKGKGNQESGNGSGGTKDVEKDEDDEDSDDMKEPTPPPATQPSLKKYKLEAINQNARARVQRAPEKRKADADDIYGASRFDGFGDYMRRKRAKLQIQNAEIDSSEGRRDNRIFEGLAIYINGYTQPSVQELRQLIVQHGGTFQPYLDRKSIVTHIITCSLTAAKIKEFKNMKVARPEWLVESAKAGELLPWKDFIYSTNQRPENVQGTKTPPRPVSAATKRLAPHIAPVSPSKRPRIYPPEETSANASTTADIPRYAALDSNPNAKRVMANPEWRAAHTSVASDFIEGYYKNSRLHHLATWKAELKSLVAEAQDKAESDGLAVGDHHRSHTRNASDDDVSMRGAALVMQSPHRKDKGKAKAHDEYPKERVIMHCDFDCFFVSAGLVSRPELKGKPVVVCHSSTTGNVSLSTSEIASCSYEARKFGVKNGMSLQQARKLCPQVQTIPYEFTKYKEFSLKFYTILMKHADDLQAVSVDEALIDVSNAVHKLKRSQQQEQDPFQTPQRGPASDPAKDLAELIRTEIRQETSCEVSIGISHNILLARLATRKAKPAQSYHLLPAEVSSILAPLSISDLHGFGHSIKQKAQEKLGATTLGELAKNSKAVLCDALGPGNGEKLYNAIRGVDDKQLESDKPRKSVSCEINYGIRFEDNEQAEVFVRQMATEVAKRLREVDMLGRSITLKVMKRSPSAPVEPSKFLGHGPCENFNKQGPLVAPNNKATNDERIIGDHAWRMLKSFNFDPKDLRGIGIQLQKLESTKATAKSNAGTGTGSVLPSTSASVGRSTSLAPKTSSSITMPPPAAGPSKPQQRAVASTSNAPKKPTSELELPTFSQVDRSVFDALPPEIRQELEQEYKRRSDSEPPVIPPDPSPPTRRSIIIPGVKAPLPKRTSLFPKGKPNPNYKKIVQQLAPRNAPSISPRRSKLYNIISGLKIARNPLSPVPQQRLGLRIADYKLREIDIDPDVFFALPEKVQREQLIRARLLKKNVEIPETPSQLLKLRPKPIVHPPGWEPYIAPPPYARYKVVPFIRQQGPTPHEKIFFANVEDIQRIVEKWVRRHRRWAPNVKDLGFLSKYLLQAVDKVEATDVDLANAIAIMKWWMLLLKRHWGAEELDDPEFDTESQVNPVGKAWWAAFRNIKDQMDEIAKKKWGGRLSLR